MLFNSYEFILLFLPITLILFSVISRYGATKQSLSFLVFASLFFYGWWNPSYLVLISASIVFNYLLGSTLQREGVGKKSKKFGLICGVIVNLSLLGYYKYGGFLVDIYNDIGGGSVAWVNVALPLAISFFTFQQITYLIDSAAGKVHKSTFLEYSVFVTFFPQLIAGPIVHHGEMMPQFKSPIAVPNRENIQIGLALFAIGLFKKTILADSMARYVAPIYDAASSDPITFLEAWIAGFGFTLQIYFDFSGYSDMALGAARMFGIVLPINFNSPLKARNIIDFWSRWHITLTRMLTDYLYTPLAVRAARSSANRQHKYTAQRKLYEFATIVAIPTLVTMVLVGIWHGSGYQFAVFGLLHGSFLTINHAWQMLAPKHILKGVWLNWCARILGQILTLTAVSAAMFFFRADSLATASEMLVSMAGLNGISVPEGIFVQLGFLKNILLDIGVSIDSSAGSLITFGGLHCAVLLFIALSMPNSLDLMREYNPATGYSATANLDSGFLGKGIWRRCLWNPTRYWAIVIGVLLAIGVLSLQEHSEFLYWQF